MDLVLALIISIVWWDLREGLEIAVKGVKAINKHLGLEDPE
jgi:hypothetical protein